MDINVLKMCLHKSYLSGFAVLCVMAGVVHAEVLLAPSLQQQQTQQAVIHQLAREHYIKYSLDDALSDRFLDAYLLALDPFRAYLTVEDVRQLAHYRYQLDDALKAADLMPAYTIFKLFQNRRLDRLNKLLTEIEKGVDRFSFDNDEYFELDRKEVPWAEDQLALDQLWHKRLKADILNRLLKKESHEDIQETLTKKYRTRLRLAKQVSNEDIFQTYINALTQLYDPHTEYFSPKTSENFNINMSLSLEGIGALLRLEDEHTTVARLIPAGPADKGGELQPDDKITAVGQGTEGEMVDIVGWRLDDVVDLIRGPKDTVVRLEVISDGDSETKIIHITRNTVKLEEQSAKATVLEIDYQNEKRLFATITIPIFYSDFNGLREGNPDYRSTAKDVYDLLMQLREEQFEGIVVDLRNNGGGALQEANNLIRLFVNAGPTVQVRYANNKINVFNNVKNNVIYKGPLVVLTNRLSASASEIFAGAVQDYRRGLIVGNRTYGKGTVQVLNNLKQGQLKITQAKFYRVSGKSTQNLGITPDIQLPAVYDPKDIGESTLDYALEGDSIRRARYRQHYPVKLPLQSLRDRHQARVAKDIGLSYISNAFERGKTRRAAKAISLSIHDRRLRDKEDETWQITQENIKRAAKCLPQVTSMDELENLAKEEMEETPIAGCIINPDFSQAKIVAELQTGKAQMGSDETEKSDTLEDALLIESGKILMDWIALQKEQKGPITLRSPEAP